MFKKAGVDFIFYETIEGLSSSMLQMRLCAKRLNELSSLFFNHLKDCMNFHHYSVITVSIHQKKILLLTKSAGLKSNIPSAKRNIAIFQN